MILSVFFILAVPAMALGAPETSFDRTFSMAQTPATSASVYKPSLAPAPRTLLSKEAILDYAAKMKPYSYQGSADLATLLQAPSAFIAPTTLLLFAVSLLPFCSLWGLTQSLSLLFAPMPFTLSPANVGALMTGPWLLATGAVAAFTVLPLWQTKFTPRIHMATLAGGTLLSFIGVLALGLHVAGSMTPDQTASNSIGDAAPSIFDPDYLGKKVSFPAVSILLGLLAAGVYALDATARPLVRMSTQFTSSSLSLALRNSADMDAGVVAWRSLFAGIFVMVVPRDVWSFGGLRGYCIGASVAQILVAAGIGAVWWLWGENVRRWDGRIMRLVDMDMLKRSGSFFDMD
jgi:hypothetical protein